jgi:peptidyl-prolyl cis-trans isomerase A (cyclophilin A)
MRRLVPLLASFLVLGIAAAARAADDPPAEKPAPKKEAPARPVVAIETSGGTIVVELFSDQAPRTVETFLGLAEGRIPFKDLKADPKGGKEATRPFYDGLIFHRVIKGFMIQGGCPLGQGTGNPIPAFPDEINAVCLGLDKIAAFTGGRPHDWVLPSLPNQAAFQELIVKPLLKKHGIDPRDQATIRARAADLDKELQAMNLKQLYELMGYVYTEKHDSTPPNRGVIAMANSGPNTNSSQFFITVGDAPWLTGKHTVFGRVIEGMGVADALSELPTDAQGRTGTPIVIRSIRQRR